MVQRTLFTIHFICTFLFCSYGQQKKQLNLHPRPAQEDLYLHTPCPKDSILRFQANNPFVDVQHCVIKEVQFDKYPSPTDTCQPIYSGQFHLSTFKSGLDFSQRAWDNVNINTCSIQHSLSCFESQIKGSFILYNSNLMNATFNRARITGLINFNHSTITEELSFSQASISDNGKISFVNTILPGRIDLSFVSPVPNQIDLTLASFSDSIFVDRSNPIQIQLYKADIPKIHFDYLHFRLSLPDTIIAGNEIIPLKDEDKAEIYEAVLQNFKSRGQNQSYQLLDIEYHNFQWRESPLPLVGWIKKWWWNYGYNKEWIFWWTIGFIIFFSLLNIKFLPLLLKDVYNIEGIPEIYPPINGVTRGRKAKRVYYSFVYTCNIFFKLSLKTERINFAKWYWALYVLIIYTLGVVCIAYMANFVIQH